RDLAEVVVVGCARAFRRAEITAVAVRRNKPEHIHLLLLLIVRVMKSGSRNATDTRLPRSDRRDDARALARRPVAAHAIERGKKRRSYPDDGCCAVLMGKQSMERRSAFERFF